MVETSRIRMPSVTGATTDGSSFDRELAGVMWHRSRLIFLVGLIGSSVAIIFNQIYGLEPISQAHAAWQLPLLLTVSLSYAIGLVLIHRGDRTLARVQGLAIMIVAFSLIILIPLIAAFHPQRDPFLPVALILFTTAAFLPCRNAQVWLAGMTVVLAAVSEFLFPELITEVGRYWDGFDARTALFERLWRVVGVSMLGGVSVLVSRSLYRLQRSAHKAKRLGNYLIEKELGAGGMGKVYLARHAMICRPTAIKVLSSPEDTADSALARFEREVQLSASLTHPNTITIFDFGRTADDTFYYAMEYLEGLDLDKLVEHFGPVPPERAIYFLRQVCGSLSEAHGRGIVHRDIKPSNVFITHRGGLYDFVKVLDFGLARKVQQAEETGLTKTGMVLGTPRYIAPESIYGTKRSDARSDLYNLGGVAYWMLTGRPLFPGASSVDLIIDHVKTIPEPPSAVAEQSIPRELDAVIMKCLEKDPDDRYQTSDELVQALQKVPVGPPWSQDLARAWWDEHGSELGVGETPASDWFADRSLKRIDVAVGA